MLIINNMWWNIFYTYACIYFITYVKFVDGCSTNGFTATFTAGVTKIWHRVCIVASSASKYYGWRIDGNIFFFVSHPISVSFKSCLWTVAVDKVWWIRTSKSNELLPVLPGHMGVTWKLPQKQCSFGNQGLS